MSGIVAVFHRDHQPVVPQDLDSMLQRIAYRGPDGCHRWCQASVGLGHCMLRTTPESFLENLPQVYSDLDLVITADARIDNRADLIHQLQLDPSPSHPITDSDLIAHAYRRWGESSPDHLLGDFAYVIWDRHQQQLVCVRDPLGIKPLYLYLTPEVVAIGSEIRALLALPWVPRRLNEIWLADYLVQGRAGELSPIADDQRTSLYQDLNPLPPGHRLTVGYDSHHQHRYWQLDPERETRFKTDQEYYEGFRERFLQAVDCRLRSAYPLGIQLSGGLDSSSVACCALSLCPSQPLHTYTIRCDSLLQRGWHRHEEDLYLQAVLNQGAFDPHWVPVDGLSPLRDQEQIYCHEDTAFFGPGTFFFRAVYRSTQSYQTRVVLDGVGGDDVVSHGLPYLSQLARSRDWLQLLQQVQVMRTFQRSPWPMFAGLFWHHQIKPSVIRGPLRQVWQRLSTRPRGISILEPEFADRVGVYERRRGRQADRKQYSSLRGQHYLSLMAGLLQHSLLILDKTAAGVGVEARHPFYDRRVVEYCLSLPIELKLRQGYSRWVLRQGMDGLLPPLVQWRRSKADFTPLQIHSLLTQEASLLDSILSGEISSVLSGYIDPHALVLLHHRSSLIRNRERAHLHPSSVQEVLLIWSIVSLALWLSHTQITP